jgi:hypothetical protein
LHQINQSINQRIIIRLVSKTIRLFIHINKNIYIFTLQRFHRHALQLPARRPATKTLVNLPKPNPTRNNDRKSAFRAVVVSNVHSSARVRGTLTNCGVITRVAAGTNGINVCQACMFTAFNVRSSARKAPVASRAYMDTP